MNRVIKIQIMQSKNVKKVINKQDTQSKDEKKVLNKQITQERNMKKTAKKQIIRNKNMKKNNVITVMKTLKAYYPEATCSLNFETPFQLLVAVMLSAQCTDERVNKTTPILFKNYSTPEAVCKMKLHDLEKIIHPCGFYRNKAKNIKATAEMIVNKYNGEVPCCMEELITLPGVGRKSANVVMLEAFNNPQGIAIDTHAKRICNKTRNIKKC